MRRCMVSCYDFSIPFFSLSIFYRIFCSFFSSHFDFDCVQCASVINANCFSWILIDRNLYCRRIENAWMLSFHFVVLFVSVGGKWSHWRHRLIIKQCSPNNSVSTNDIENKNDNYKHVAIPKITFVNSKIE